MQTLVEHIHNIQWYAMILANAEKLKESLEEGEMKEAKELVKRLVESQMTRNWTWDERVSEMKELINARA